MMRAAEANGSLAQEQYDSRKRQRAVSMAVNKDLSNDIMRQLKLPCTLCSKDAKSFYDLIGHAQASLAMQRQGVPKSVVDCLFSTLQNETHQVRTGFGDSILYYGGSKWLFPLRSIGQGNGAGPATWAVVSTPLLNLLPKQGFGCEIVNPITGKKYVFVGYAFVDNTDIIESKSGLSLSECVTGLQQVLDTWEGALKATCGAIVPEKHFGTW
jgi:hypothetical protein